MIVYLELHGALRRAATESDGRTARVAVPAGACVADVVAAAGLSPGDVWRVARAGDFVDLSAATFEGDRLVVFPPLGGGADAT